MLARKKLTRSKQVLLVLSCLVTIGLMLAGCDSGSTQTVKPTPTPVTFVQLPLDIPQKALNAPITGNVPASQQLHVGVTFKLNQQTLDQMSKSNVAKPGETTSANDIAQKLGISDSDFQAIKNFFGASNATLQLGKTRTSMTIDIKAGSLEQLLQTKFVLHKLNNRTFYTPDPKQMPKIPSTIANNVLAVTGLDNYSLPPTNKFQVQSHQTQIGAVSGKTAQANANCAPDSSMVNWKQVSHAYGYDKFWQQGWHGENSTINLVEIDGTKQSDLQTYFACVGYKGSVDFINIDGNAPKPEGETTLDIEMIAGLAPYAHMKDYQTDISKAQDGGWNNLMDALQRIIDDNAAHPNPASSVSMSLGVGEGGVTGELTKAMSQRFQLLTKAEHMTVYVASGDCGAYEDRVFGVLSVSYPASDPWAVGVGGTTITTNSARNRATETAWTGIPNPISCMNAWGTGGGVSKLLKKPDWQQAPGVNNKYSTGYRQSPDIAAVADNLAVYLDGAWTPIGGTSAATPIWAAGMTLVNQGLIATKGFYIYGPGTFYYVQSREGNLKPYYDEVTGTNLYYKATPGWDYTTGLGSPNLPTLFQVISNNATA
jgi:kumamolisin